MHQPCPCFLTKVPPYTFFDIFVIGHYHIDQGIHSDENGKYFINIGSMTRGTLSEEDIAHSPQIGFIKISVEENKEPVYALRTINLKVSPASEIFDLEKKEQENKEQEEIALFVEKIAAEALEKTEEDNSETVSNILSSMDMAKAVRERVLYFIQEATIK